MATHDYILANASGAAFRTDLNNALAAIVSNNSNSSQPATMYAYQWWVDTSANIVKIRNSSNNAWINLFTTAGGVDVDAASTFSEDVTFAGASANIIFDKSADDLIFNDNAKAVFGTSSDGLEIFHNGSGSFITDSGTGDLHIRSSDDLKFETADGSETYLVCNQNGSVQIYHDNENVLTTTATGIIVSNTNGNGELRVRGSEGNGAQIYIDADDADDNEDQWRLDVAASDGSFGIQNFGDGSFEKNIECNHGGNVELYFDNAKKLDTLSGGVNISGDLTFDTNFNQVGGKISLTTQSGFTQPSLVVRNTGNNASATLIKFEGYNASEIGSISGFVNQTSYNTSSDYRLKENVVALVDSLTRIKTLKPYRFNFKDNKDLTVDGFFAHEVSSAVPQAVTGEKDGTEMQQIDHSKLVPLLVAAVQELIGKVAALEAA